MNTSTYTDPNSVVRTIFLDKVISVRWLYDNRLNPSELTGAVLTMLGPSGFCMDKPNARKLQSRLVDKVSEPPPPGWGIR